MMIALLVNILIVLLIGGVICAIIRILGPYFGLDPVLIANVIKIIGLIVLVYIVIMVLGLLTGSPVFIWRGNP